MLVKTSISKGRKSLDAPCFTKRAFNPAKLGTKGECRRPHLKHRATICPERLFQTTVYKLFLRYWGRRWSHLRDDKLRTQNCWPLLIIAVICAARHLPSSGVQPTMVRLITHNLLACHAKGCNTNNFPLQFKDVEVEIREAEFNAEFLERFMPKIEWTALVDTARQVSTWSFLSEKLSNPFFSLGDIKAGRYVTTLWTTRDVRRRVSQKFTSCSFWGMQWTLCPFLFFTVVIF